MLKRYTQHNVYLSSFSEQHPRNSPLPHYSAKLKLGSYALKTPPVDGVLQGRLTWHCSRFLHRIGNTMEGNL